MTSKRLNRVGDPPGATESEDGLLAALDRAELSLEGADAATAKAVRDQADASHLLASRSGLTRLARRAAGLCLKAEARLGDLHPAGKRGAKSSCTRARTFFSGHDIKRLRQVSAASHLLGDYLADCEARDRIPSRRGLLNLASRIRRQKAAEQAELARARAAAASIHAPRSRVPGEPPRSKFDVEDGNPYQNLADQAIQAIQTCQARRKELTELAVFERMGDELLGQWLSLAGLTVQFVRDWRESHHQGGR